MLRNSYNVVTFQKVNLVNQNGLENSNTGVTFQSLDLASTGSIVPTLALFKKSGP